MARHYTVHSEDLALCELKRQLENSFRIQISSHGDCKKLSEELDSKGISISAMTLSRCFGISKSTHRPFISTLDLLVSYLGFQSFHHFKNETSDFIQFALAHPEMKFIGGEYAYTALELAIQVNDWKTTRSLIEAFDPKPSTGLDFIWFLGEQVRKHPEQNQFLSMLANTENGRKYYYESFVDEDDPNEYYSTALKLHYNPTVKSIGDQLFYYAYLDAKRIYKGLKVDETHRDIYTESGSIVHTLHYQQVSRLFEMRILNEFRGLNRFSEMEKIVDELLPLIANKYWRDQNWMLMRSVKALVFSGHFKLFMQHHKELKKQLIQQFRYCEGTMLSSADLALQFVVHASSEFKDVVQLPPTRLRHPIYNEEKARIAIESATATLYTNSALRKSMHKNLQTFTAGNEHSWVTKLVQI
jgi:hypothetical protein